MLPNMIPRCGPKNVLWVEPVTRSAPSANGFLEIWAEQAEHVGRVVMNDRPCGVVGSEMRVDEFRDLADRLRVE